MLNWKKEAEKELPKYSYPPNVLTAAMLQRLGRYGVDYKLKARDCVLISALDSQRAEGKAIFGGGLLLSEKAAAEKAAAVEWPLSDRETAIIKKSGGGKRWLSISLTAKSAGQGLARCAGRNSDRHRSTHGLSLAAPCPSWSAPIAA